jgi:hypothetical protein
VRGAISNDRPYRDLTEQCGHKTFQISGFWADYGQTTPYRLFAPNGVAIRPRSAGWQLGPLPFKWQDWVVPGGRIS